MRGARMIGAMLVTLAIAVTAQAKDDPRGKPLVSEEAAAEYAATAKTYDVRILRDTWGVPHIFGKRDADAAFGLGFAQCEDDFATLQETVLMCRGTLAAVKGQEAAPADFLVSLLGTWDYVESKYESDLSPETRAICEAYADAANFYASLHPDALFNKDVLPITGKDVVAGFTFRGPFFYGLDNAVMELFGKERRREISEKRASLAPEDFDMILAGSRDLLSKGTHLGSNTFAVGPERSVNDETYLNINSHQPWTGPVAWYEAHVHSEEGWNAVGGTFPGAPIILHGHNPHLGWAHTVNSPDLIDVYVLTINPDNEDQYLYDGEWLDFEKSEASLRVKVEGSSFVMPIRREVLRSVHGPAMRTEHGVYAVRYAGAGDVRAVEQWYRMNKATSMDEWLGAMKMRAIPSLNCGYGDKEGNILYLYNALLPKRTEGYDYEMYLPGDTSEVVWDEYLPFEQLPMVKNPDSGFIQNCNSTPFQTTTGDDNPDPDNFSDTLGIETHMTNRGLRAIELFGADESITYDEFKAYKYDMRYSEDSYLGKSLDAFLASPLASEDALSDKPLMAEAVALLKDYDLGVEPENTGAALAVLVGRDGFRSGGDHAEPEAFAELVEKYAGALKAAYGQIDVPWSTVNRLQRGDVDLGVGGGPDVLHAIYGRLTEDNAKSIGTTGDSYVLLVRWDADGTVHSESIHQFGSATLDEASPHYADQAELFVKRELKPVWMEEAEIRKHLEREYRPIDMAKK